MLISIIILSVLLTLAVCGLVACYVIIGLQSDKINTYEEWIMEFNKDVQNTYIKLKQIDNRGIFQKDDDVGFAFSDILAIVEKLRDKSK